MMPTRFALVVCAGLMSGFAADGQQPQQPKPMRFEVAAIRPADPKAIGTLVRTGPPGGNLQFVNMPLRDWVEMALSVPDFALKAPPWLEGSRFDLDATLPADRALGRDAMEQMLRTLLVERFELKWHEEAQTVPGYELVVDKKVLAPTATMLERLTRSGARSEGPGLIAGTNMPMPELAEKLGKALGRPVIDSTHLTDGYDFKLMWRPESESTVAEWERHGMDVANLPGSVFAAVREQLGLRLQSAKVPSKVIVVDHMDLKPSAN
jgi:uncharacterized protein (TIGR03435 family)